MNKEFIIHISRVPLIGRRILKLITEREGGEKESEALRVVIANKYNVFIDKYTYGSCFKRSFNTGGIVHIGRYCSIGSDVSYFGADHPIDHAVMSAYFYNKSFSKLNVNDVERHTLVIGHDVWMGHGSTIVSSCHQIGNGSVIAAGAVVTKDVPAYAIVGGVPARVLRFRFDKSVQDKLEESKWWELEPDKLYNFYDYINQPKIWAEKIINYRNA